jgi:thiol-disulfide isomerase/thioredoxin
MSDSSSSSSSHWTIEFFGPKLLATAATSKDQQNSNPPKEVISSTKVLSAIDDDTRINTTTKSIVGLYFSASWCPPCKTFTPMLIDFYNVINNKNGLNKKPQQQTLEIVFVSSDHEEQSFTNYYTKMPWLAILFDENQKRRNLMTMFKIQVSVFVFISNDDDCVTK